MNFSQAINKLQNGKGVYRSSWANGIYLYLLANLDVYQKVYPNNLTNPCVSYSLSNSDVNATDWLELA